MRSYLRFKTYIITSFAFKIKHLSNLHTSTATIPLYITCPLIIQHTSKQSIAIPVAQAPKDAFISILLHFWLGEKGELTQAQ